VMDMNLRYRISLRRHSLDLHFCICTAEALLHDWLPKVVARLIVHLSAASNATLRYYQQIAD
jgi:hypothetical protein